MVSVNQALIYGIGEPETPQRKRRNPTLFRRRHPPPLPQVYIPRKCCRNASYPLPGGAPFSPPRPFPRDCKSPCFRAKPDIRGRALPACFAFLRCSGLLIVARASRFCHLRVSIDAYTRKSKFHSTRLVAGTSPPTTPCPLAYSTLCVAETVQVPTMAESITEGTLKTWNKKVGDSVAADEEVATIETDKV